jgi:hypothetical protein
LPYKGFLPELLREFDIQKVEEGLVTVFCEFIFCKWGKPVNFLITSKIDLGSDKRIRQIRLFVDELLEPLLTSLYPWPLWNACHGSLPYNSHEGKFTIEGLSVVFVGEWRTGGLDCWPSHDRIIHRRENSRFKTCPHP